MAIQLDVDALCPHIERDEALGVVHWNAKAAAWESFSPLFGQSFRASVLIPSGGEATAPVRRALFADARRRLDRLGAAADSCRRSALKAWSVRLRREGEAGPVRPVLQCVQLLERQAVLLWGLEGEPYRPPISFWCDDDGQVREEVEINLPVLTHPPEWLLALPTHREHPAIGATTLVLAPPLYLAVRPALEPRLVRIDLDDATAAPDPDALFERVGTRLMAMGGALERTKAELSGAFEAIFRRRARLFAEWAVFLVDGSSAFLFENLGTERSFKNLSARFDAHGALASVALTTPKETVEREVSALAEAP